MLVHQFEHLYRFISLEGGPIEIRLLFSYGGHRLCDCAEFLLGSLDYAGVNGVILCKKVSWPGENHQTYPSLADPCVSAIVEQQTSEPFYYCQTEHYYRLHLLTRTKKHGMPVQSRCYFFALWDSFASSGAMQLWLAEYQGTIGIGEITFLSGSTTRYGYNASDQRYLGLAPNHLLVLTAIKWACLHNYQVLDFGRTACDNAGLMEFKRRWGAVKELLPYYYYPSMAGLATTSEHTWKFRLLTSCWKRLPTDVAGWLGSRLYPYLG